MSAAEPQDLERLLSLLADRALQGLDKAEQAELAALVDEFPALDEGVLDRTVAEIEIAVAPEPEPLPLPMRRGLERAVRERFAPEPIPSDPAVDSALPSGNPAEFEATSYGRTEGLPGSPLPTNEAVPARSASLSFRETLAWTLAVFALLLAVAGWWPRITGPAEAPPNAPPPLGSVVDEPAS